MEPFEYPAMYSAELDHWWYRCLHAAVIHQLATPSLPTDARLLDLGCGTGGLLWRIHRRFPRVTSVGLDYSPLALELAAGRRVGGLVRGDAKALPFADASFDAITSLDVLYTREAYPGLDRTLARCHDLLRPGGRLILQLPACEAIRSQHDAHVHTAHRFTAAEVRDALKNAGFGRIRVRYRCHLLFLAAWVVRKWLRRPDRGSEVVTPSGSINALAGWYGHAENVISRWLPLPFGLSVFAVAYRD